MYEFLWWSALLNYEKHTDKRNNSRQHSLERKPNSYYLTAAWPNVFRKLLLFCFPNFQMQTNVFASETIHLSAMMKIDVTLIPQSNAMPVCLSASDTIQKSMMKKPYTINVTLNTQSKCNACLVKVKMQSACMWDNT